MVAAHQEEQVDEEAVEHQEVVEAVLAQKAVQRLSLYARYPQLSLAY